MADKGPWTDLPAVFDGATVIIVNVKINRAVDIKPGSPGNGTPSECWPVDLKKATQLWKLRLLSGTDHDQRVWTLYNQATNKFLELKDGNPANETPIQIWDKREGDGDARQKWVIHVAHKDDKPENQVFLLRNVAGRKIGISVLDAFNSNDIDGNKNIGFEWRDTSNQVWRIWRFA